MDESRWIDINELNAPEVDREGFESSVLDREIWSKGNAEEPEAPVAPETPVAPEAPAEPVAPAPEKQLWLARTNSQSGETIRIEGEGATIGKSREADCTIKGNQSISRIHARVSRENGEYYIEDCGSLNHTYLNDEIVTGPKKLTDGAMVRLADENFVVRIV